jgi:hypothetical protein
MYGPEQIGFEINSAQIERLRSAAARRSFTPQAQFLRESRWPISISTKSALELDPEKWELVFGKDHAPTIS